MAKYGLTVTKNVTSAVGQPVTSGVDISSDMPNVTQNVTNGRLTMSQRHAAIKAYLEGNKNPGASAFGSMFGVDRKTIYRDLEALGIK